MADQCKLWKLCKGVSHTEIHAHYELQIIATKANAFSTSDELTHEVRTQWQQQSCVVSLRCERMDGNVSRPASHLVEIREDS